MLVCNAHYELEKIDQLYRDRADCENGFDEIKNQWGWGGYSTHDIERCALSARAVALVYNWWVLVRAAGAPQLTKPQKWFALVRYIVERILGRAPKPNLGLNALGTG